MACGHIAYGKLGYWWHIRPNLKALDRTTLLVMLRDREEGGGNLLIKPPTDPKKCFSHGIELDRVSRATSWKCRSEAHFACTRAKGPWPRNLWRPLILIQRSYHLTRSVGICIRRTSWRWAWCKLRQTVKHSLLICHVGIDVDFSFMVNSPVISLGLLGLHLLVWNWPLATGL